MRPVDSKRLTGSRVSAWFSDTAKKQAFSRSAWLEMGGIEVNNPTTAAYHFISSKGRKGEIPPGINFAFSTKMFYDSQIPPGCTLCSYLEVPGRGYGVSDPFDEELLSLKGPIIPKGEPAVHGETSGNDTLTDQCAVHNTEFHTSGNNSLTPILINESLSPLSFHLPEVSQPCEGEIQTRLLLSSSSDTDTSQTPTSRHLASAFSPQPLECLYDVFSNTADPEPIPAQENIELITDFGSGVITTPRVRQTSTQEFFTPEIQPLPNSAVLSIPTGSPLRNVKSSPPAVSSQFPSTVISQNSPGVDMQSPPAVNTQFPPAVNTQFPPAVNSEKFPGVNSQSPPTVRTDFPPAVISQNFPGVNMQSPPAVNTPFPPAVNTPFPPAVNSLFSPDIYTQFSPAVNMYSPPGVNRQSPPAVSTQFPPAVSTQFPPAETSGNDKSTDQYAVHDIGSHSSRNNSPTPILISESLSPFSSLTYCEAEIQTRLLLSSSSDTDTSQTPNSRHLASAFSPQPLECLYDVFSNTADPEPIPTQENIELITDFGSGVNTTPRVRQTSSQEFFTPEIQPLHNSAVLSSEGNTTSPGTPMNDPTHSPPTVNTQFPPAVNTQFPPAVNTQSSQVINTQSSQVINTQFPPAVNMQSPPAVNTQFPPAVNTQSSQVINTQSSLVINTQFPPAVNMQSPPAVNTQFPPAVNTQFPPAVNTQSSQVINTQSSQVINTQFPPSINLQSPPAVNTQFPPAVNSLSPRESPVPSQHISPDIIFREEDVYSSQDSAEMDYPNKLTFSPSSLLQSYHDITSGSDEKARSYFSEKELAFLRKYDQITF